MARSSGKREFDDICAKTIDAMALPQAEITDAYRPLRPLKPRIAKLDETASKVYLKRLQMCRELFVFVLENPSKGSP